MWRLTFVILGASVVVVDMNDEIEIGWSGTELAKARYFRQSRVSIVLWSPTEQARHVAVADFNSIT